MTAWQDIRILRHRPGGLAANDPERAAVFVSALEQSEQLMRAAQAIGTAARPLPLFYALSQAGRAIAAHRLDDNWRLAGHGLTDRSERTTPLLERTVAPAGGQPHDGRQPSFAGVAEAVGSEPLTGPVELGTVWAALPDLIPPVPQVPELSRLGGLPLRPLYAVDGYWDTPDSWALSLQNTRLQSSSARPCAGA